MEFLKGHERERRGKKLPTRSPSPSSACHLLSCRHWPSPFVSGLLLHHTPGLDNALFSSCLSFPSRVAAWHCLWALRRRQVLLENLRNEGGRVAGPVRPTLPAGLWKGWLGPGPLCSCWFLVPGTLLSLYWPNWLFLAPASMGIVCSQTAGGEALTSLGDKSRWGWGSGWQMSSCFTFWCPLPISIPTPRVFRVSKTTNATSFPLLKAQESYNAPR